MRPGLVEMVAAADTGARVEGERGRRKDPLPRPICARLRELSPDGIRELDARSALVSIPAIERAHPVEVKRERLNEAGWE